MPEPVRSSLHGPWYLVGVHCDLCWVSRSLDSGPQGALCPGDALCDGVVHDVALSLVVTAVLWVLKLLPKGHPLPEPVRSSLQDVPWTWEVWVWVVVVGVALLAQICAKAGVLSLAS